MEEERDFVMLEKKRINLHCQFSIQQPISLMVKQNMESDIV